jgi:murein DD-endopeptidase MepM/ murein hydrolase activator NlpD
MMILITSLNFISCSKKKDTSPPSLSYPFVDQNLTVQFLVFGYDLNPGQKNPAYEIVVSNRNTNVTSATSGTVTRISFNGGGLMDESQNDFEVFIEHKKNSIYTLIYDHVRNLEVEVGDSVVPGTILGDVGWSSGGGGTHGRTELQINKKDISVCPKTLGTTEFNAAFETALALNNVTYPIGLERHFEDVCLADTVTP